MDFKVFESVRGSSRVISFTFWTPLFRNRHIPYKLHYYFLSFSISVLYFLSRSTTNKGNINANGSAVISRT